MNETSLLIALENIPLPLRSGHQPLLKKLMIREGTTTVITGGNGSGKTLLGHILKGDAAPQLLAGRTATIVNQDIEFICFDSALNFIRLERRRDESDLHGGAPDLGRSLRAMLDGVNNRRVDDLLERFNLLHLLDRGVRAFSSGELRKSMLVLALIHSPKVLIIDDPFDGLDIDSREELHHLLDEIRHNAALVLLSGRLKDVPDFADQIVHLDDPGLPRPESSADPGAAKKWRIDLLLEERRTDLTTPLIEMRNVSVSYGEQPILREIDWSVVAGEAWQIVGPNGAGKTTILELISGDNTKGYGQELFLFGRRKGSGESVWEIKEQIGHVSASMQGRLSPRTLLKDLILSGFFDSLDLYDRPGAVQLEKADAWAELFGITEYLHLPLKDVSFGIQRVALIVRAMVKQPLLLILDEPCQGLDEANSDHVLTAAGRVVEHNLATLLYVSHDADYRIPGLNSFLRLTQHPSGGYTAYIERNDAEASDGKKTV